MIHVHTYKLQKTYINQEKPHVGFGVIILSSDGHARV